MKFFSKQNKIFSKKYMFYLLLFILLFLFIYFFTFKYIENFENDNKNTIVIARYNEDISYIFNQEFNNYNIIVYNKGSNITDEKIIQRCTIINLSNVGKCDHTYLQYIIDYYNKLPNVTIFLPASFYHMDYKKNRGINILNKVNETNNSVFPSMSYGKSTLENEYLYNFQIDNWESSFSSNKTSNVNNKTTPSPIRPYGKWFEKHFPNNDCPYVVYMGLFAVSKDDILKNPIEKYKTLIDYVDKDPNPEAGHYMERAWLPLFYPLEESKLYPDL